MPVVRSFVCPDCHRQFDHLFTDREPEPPDYCPRCGSYVGDDPQPELSAPAIGGSAKVAKVDEVYRALEASGEARAEMAAKMTGGDKADFSSLKITNIKTGLKPGEAATQVAMTATGAAMDQRARQMSFSAAGAEFAARTRVGPEVGWGDRTRQEGVNIHTKLAARVVAAGNMGSHKAARK